MVRAQVLSTIELRGRNRLRVMEVSEVVVPREGLSYSYFWGLRGHMHTYNTLTRHKQHKGICTHTTQTAHAHPTVL